MNYEFVHTAELCYKLNYQDKQSLRRLYKPKELKVKDNKRIKKYTYAIDNNKITSWFFLSECMYLYFIINLQKFGDAHSTPPERVQAAYTCLQEEFSPYIAEFNISKLVLNRIDYKVDVKMDKPLRAAYIKQLNLGYKGYGKKYLRRFDHGYYLESESMTLNIYDKLQEFINHNKNSDIAEFFRPNKLQFLRVELQVKAPHIRYRHFHYGLPQTLEHYYTQEYWMLFFEKYVQPILMNGFYHKLEFIQAMLQQQELKYNMSTRLMDFVQDIHTKGLEKVKKENINRFYAYRAQLESLGINPIPLFNGCPYKSLPSLYDAAVQSFYDSTYDITSDIYITPKEVLNYV